MIRALVTTIVVVAAGGALGAQTPARAQGPGTIAGVVTDTAGNPVDSADVVIASLKRRAISAAGGRFRFDDVKPGRYDVSARRLGYAPQVRAVVVGADGGVVNFQLLPTPRVLAPVISSVSRGGLSGVIGDTAYNIVRGAEIVVIGANRRTASDSLGRFYMDLHPGKYMVRIQRPGYVSRMVSVTVPNDSGRQITVWLAPGDNAAYRREAAAVDDLRDRLVHRTSMSTVYTREDLNRTSMTELTQIIAVGSGRRVSESCGAIIDGGPHRLPYWSIPTADIETVEIYPPKSLTGVQPIIRVEPELERDCPVLVYVWLRK